MYTDTITLFNRKENRSGDIWYPSILHNVNLNVDKAEIIAKYGAESKDASTLNVKYTISGNQKTIGGKVWLPPKEWDALVDPSECLTFTAGEAFDFFWLGEWEGTEPIYSENYAWKNGFYNYMNDMYDFVFAISSVGGPYTVIPHFEILGK